jgi:hypothetical protein
LNKHAHFGHILGSTVFVDDGGVEFCAHEAEGDGDRQRRVGTTLEPEMAAGESADARWWFRMRT